LRPVEDLFNAARLSFASGSWDAVIDQLLALRTADPQYRVAEVDGMLYMALRNRGVDKILNRRNLEGGAFDLALAERFGPLDVEAGQARELARLYALGLSFWEVYPEQAVFYFGQVAAAAPYLSDASGWTAQARYAAALAQWGNQLLSAGDPCSAQEKYELAAQAGAGGEAQAAAAGAAEACSPPTEIPSPTDLATVTPTDTLQPGTAIPTTAAPSATQTIPVEFTPTFTGTPTVTSPAATSSPTAELSPTPTPTTPPSESPPTSEPTQEETRAPVEPAAEETAAP
jgi:hypothetical protein